MRLPVILETRSAIDERGIPRLSSLSMSTPTKTDEYRDASPRGAFKEIPVIDVSPLWGSDAEALDGLIEQIRLACSCVGFFYIKNHGIPPELIARAYRRSKLFFELPEAEKQACHIAKSAAHRGFIPLYEESFYETLGSAKANRDHKEAFQIGIDLSPDHPNFLPGIPLLGANLWPAQPGFKEDMGAYFEALLGLSRRLFQAFALALFLPRNHFDSVITRPPSVLRIAHYVKNDFPMDAVNWGISAHTDYEVFTILHTDGPGLQALNASDEWVDVPPIDGTFIINIGDMLELLSNGAFVATSHRVLNIGRERFSFPMFCTLDYETVVAPLPQWVTEQYPAAYQPMRSGAHLYSSIIRAYGYLRKRWQAGELPMPSDADVDTYFGRSKKLQEA
jgi:isopenicillin N synthase-like dioxygenase